MICATNKDVMEMSWEEWKAAYMTDRETRVEHARIAMLNIPEVYEMLEMSAYLHPEHSGYLAYQLGNCQDIITLYKTKIEGAFPWAHIEADDITAAYAKIIKEIQEEDHA